LLQMVDQYKKTAKVVQSMDAYPKVNEDYTQYTTMGAVVTIVCALLCSTLFVSEVVRALRLSAARAVHMHHRDAYTLAARLTHPRRGWGGGGGDLSGMAPHHHAEERAVSGYQAAAYGSWRERQDEHLRGE
jgi:hypothetical protein